MNAKERVGSSKRMIASGLSGLLCQEDRGLTSVFDIGPIPGFQSDELARARTRHTACTFAWLGRHGIATHWYDKMWTESGRGLIVREARVRDQPLLSGHADADMIGLELLFRIRASEKFCGRVARDDVQLPEDVWPSGQRLCPGDRLLRPFVEASTKWERVDRYLSPEEAAAHVALDGATVASLFRWASRVAAHIDHLYSLAGAILIDGKMEAAIWCRFNGFVLIDGISLDELGVKYAGDDYGKIPLRAWYKEMHPAWFQALQRAQKEHRHDPSRWPDYPESPDRSVVDEHIKRYQLMAALLDGVLQTCY